MSDISELLDNFAIDNIRLMQGSSDMDSIEKDRAEILQAFAEKDKRIAEHGLIIPMFFRPRTPAG